MLNAKNSLHIGYNFDFFNTWMMGIFFHHSPAVTPFSPTHKDRKEVIAPRLSIRRPRIFLSSQRIMNIESIMSAKAITHDNSVTRKNVMSPACAARDVSAVALSKPSPINVVSQVRTCKTSSKFLTSPICFSNARVETTHDCRYVCYLVANHCISDIWNCNEHW